MKLNRIRIKNLKSSGLLKDFDWTANYLLDDVERLNPKCLVGVNGSGKSQLLEAITEIFYLLNEYWNNGIKLSADIEFELVYFIKRGGEILEITIQTDEKKKIDVYQKLNGKFKLFEGNPLELLPSRIIGYTSGQNETLSLRYLDIYSDYAEQVRNAALNEKSKNTIIPTPLFSWVDYESNIAVLIANFMLREKGELQFFESQIKLKSVESFRIVIQLNDKKEIKLTDELKGYIDNLKKTSTTYLYTKSIETYVFDFYSDDELKKAFDHFFDNASKLFLAFYKLGLLNELIIQKKVRQEIKRQRNDHKTVVKPPIVPDSDKVFRFDKVKINVAELLHEIDYVGLSDGEHQFVHILGTILMFDEDNSLFLLDEPESHFNPLWRIEFLKTLHRITKDRFQDFLITTHAPYLLSDTPRDDIYIFKREGNKVSFQEPSKATFGASFDELLEIAFGLKPPISSISSGRIDELVKSNSEDEIKEGLKSIGDSAQKMRLYQRIVELKKEN